MQETPKGYFNNKTIQKFCIAQFDTQSNNLTALTVHCKWKASDVLKETGYKTMK